ncbi:MAG: hypothetical protein IPM79_04850 [Polyangiaceae bacterium]|jgi:hypothetical protein|nr:hypothetical protein [Polyangiaceae bacterium]MBK8936974.1 hypothetical protein [Polyangiaceae bacterium]
MEAASPWRSEGTRWIRASGPYVVAQATDRGYYVIRVRGRAGGMSGSASSLEAARKRVDRILLDDGWALEF